MLVSVTTSELLSWFAVSVAEPGINVARSRAAWVASMRRRGMICMTSSAFIGISCGSLPVRIGMFFFFASSLELTMRLRPCTLAL